MIFFQRTLALHNGTTKTELFAELGLRQDHPCQFTSPLTGHIRRPRVVPDYSRKMCAGEKGRQASHELRKDKVFMIKALAKDPNLISCIMFNSGTGEPLNIQFGYGIF